MYELLASWNELLLGRNHVRLRLDLDGLPVHRLLKCHLRIHHSCNGEGDFVALHIHDVIDVLAHLHRPILENKPFVMRQIGLVCMAM
jgi:hypothetical protein